MNNSFITDREGNVTPKRAASSANITSPILIGEERMRRSGTLQGEEL